MRTWIDRILRRPEVAPSDAAKLRTAPSAPSRGPETELERCRRLRDRMAVSVQKLPASKLRSVTAVSLALLNLKIKKLEGAPDDPDAGKA